jgi:hypothetical protein
MLDISKAEHALNPRHHGRVLGLSFSWCRSFEDRLTQLTPRTIAAIQRMAKVLHDANAETRIVGELEEFTLDHGGTASLYARLRELEVMERREKTISRLRRIPSNHGVRRAATPPSRQAWLRIFVI